MKWFFRVSLGVFTGFGIYEFMIKDYGELAVSLLAIVLSLLALWSMKVEGE